jgi:hypothetical protein
VQARYPNLPTPGTIAKRLWPTRNIIGHPAAPSVAATSESEAQEMALTWARALADEVSRFGSPSVMRFINEYEVGKVLAEVLVKLEQIMERQAQVMERQERMYQEYLELKRRQVELLERGERRAAD